MFHSLSSYEDRLLSNRTRMNYCVLDKAFVAMLMKRNEESLYIKAKKKICLSNIAIVTLLLLIPQKVKNPVERCGANSYNHETFWHPWGNHYHKGIDIFAKKITPIHHATSLGIVIAVTYEGDFGKKNLGGNTVSVLGTHGRVYYYAHMQ